MKDCIKVELGMNDLETLCRVGSKTILSACIVITALQPQHGREDTSKVTPGYFSRYLAICFGTNEVLEPDCAIDT